MQHVVGRKSHRFTTNLTACVRLCRSASSRSFVHRRTIKHTTQNLSRYRYLFLTNHSRRSRERKRESQSVWFDRVDSGFIGKCAVTRGRIEEISILSANDMIEPLRSNGENFCPIGYTGDNRWTGTAATSLSNLIAPPPLSRIMHYFSNSFQHTYSPVAKVYRTIRRISK